MPLGLYSTHVAQKTGKRDYVPLALVPFFFGVQQFVEGLEWTAIDNGGVEPLGTLAGLGFLFFAYCFWMIWIPWSAWSISRTTDSKGLLKGEQWNGARPVRIQLQRIGMGQAGRDSSHVTAQLTPSWRGWP